MDLHNQHCYFTTLTVNGWASVFKDFPETNHLILESFNYLVDNGLVEINAFIIMMDHIHLIWRMENDGEEARVVKKFKQHTGRQILKYLLSLDQDYSKIFTSARQDREHKFWKIGHGSLRILHKDILIQKLQYIHRNPTQGNYKSVDNEEDYYFSSALSYQKQKSNFRFLHVLKGLIID